MARGGAPDALWNAFVDLVLPLAPIREHRSRFAEKPAVFLDEREIAHLEGPGHIDLRVTRQAWRRLRAEWGEDPAVTDRPGRSDWIELTLGSPADLGRLAPLIAAAVAANR